MKNCLQSLLVIGIALVKSQFHFASLGGFGGPNQRSVAATFRKDASSIPYSMIVSPGSCFSDAITALSDAKWESEFHEVYSGNEFNLQFFPVAGAHDWQGNVTALVLNTFDAYSAQSAIKKGAKWTMPNFFYHYTQTFTDASESSALLAAPEVTAFFVFIDTTILAPGFADPTFTDVHWNYLSKTLEHAAKVFDWVIVIGDRGIYSSGKNGGAKYFQDTLRPLFKQSLVDAYISGQDANMEIIEDGKLTHITCGSAGYSKSGRIRKHDGSMHFSNRSGFCRHTLYKSKLVTEFIDGLSGEVLATHETLQNVKTTNRIDKLKHMMKIPNVKYLQLPPGIGGVPGDEQPSTFSSFFVIIYGLFGVLAYLIVLASFGITVNFRIGSWISEKNSSFSQGDKSKRLITKTTHKKTHVKVEKL